MRIIVCGSRTWPEEYGTTVVFSTLQGVWNLNVYSGQPLTIVHGACPDGADKLAAQWIAGMNRWREGAMKSGSMMLPGYEVIEERHPANWDSYGLAAGPMRNREMADLGATFCVAFLYEPDKNLPGHQKMSSGTRGMMRQANLKNIPVIEIPWIV